MSCRKCGRPNGMRDERGSVALSCLCNRYIPTQINAILVVQLPRLPLDVKRIRVPSESWITKFTASDPRTRPALGQHYAWRRSSPSRPSSIFSN